jgi:hypothetical protein
VKYLRKFNESTEERHLKEYKIFENLQDNEDYITLAHLLYDLFDEFEIVEWTNETFEHPDAPFNEDYPLHKFWSFRVFTPKGLENIKQSELDKDIKEITIWNIRDTDLGFKEELDIFIREAEEVLGKEILVEVEVYADSPQEELIDYTIKIK